MKDVYMNNVCPYCVMNEFFVVCLGQELIQVLQRSQSRGYGGRSVLGRPPRVRIGYKMANYPNSGDALWGVFLEMSHWAICGGHF